MYEATAAGAKRRSVGAGQAEDQQDQSGRRHDLAEQEVPGRAVVGGPLHQRLAEHRVGQDRRRRSPRRSGRGCTRPALAGGDAGAAAAGGPPLGEGDDGVEVGAGDRAEQQDEHAEAEDGGEGVGQQLHAHVLGQLGGLDAGADHHGHQGGGADELGGGPAASGTRGGVAPGAGWGSVAAMAGPAVVSGLASVALNGTPRMRCGVERAVRGRRA